MGAAPRYFVGIDLGTTHTVVAYAEARPGAAVEVFAVEQIVSERETAARPLLPSYLFAPPPGEVSAFEGSWAFEAPYFVGEHAKRRGGEVPDRAVSSAKSWLCHPSVDRLSPILPWGIDDEGDEPLPRISPVDASERLLSHLRRAWDRAFPDAPLAQQAIVLTVPASFDEIARELTVEATARAGLSVRLLEEPQAAFYDFMHRQGDPGLSSLLSGRDEALVLVCDVGGGTTDLSLMRVERASGELSVSRVAVGDHLLLGGDNMDLALAHLCEKRLFGPGARQLSPSRFGALVASCRQAKERLLGDDPPAEVTITLLGEGSRLLGGAQRVTLTRDEAIDLLLEGFFPLVGRGELPKTRAGLVAFGLPYARDGAITRHLAAFLAKAGDAGKQAPSAVLLNGGVFHARRLSARLCEQLSSWAGREVCALPYTDPDLSVARGAVAYQQAQRGEGHRIKGGSAHAYLVGVDVAGGAQGEAVCVVPRGAEVGVRYRADLPLVLLTGKKARFELWASGNEPFAPGDRAIASDELLHRLPPLTAAVPQAAEGEILVLLEGELTEVGTLELCCVERPGPGKPPLPDARRHKLAFQLRQERSATTPPPPSVRAPPSMRPPPSQSPRKLDEATALLLAIFGKGREGVPERDVKDLVRNLEKTLGERSTWTMPVARALADVLLSNPRSRRRSAEHERLFWMLAGFLQRPGFGAPGDEARAASLFKLRDEGIMHSREARVWQAHFIALRRVAAGLPEASHEALFAWAEPFLHDGSARKKGRPEAIDELLTTIAFCERIAPLRKEKLGNALVERSWTDRDPRLWEHIGRLGARIPTYASAHYAVAPRVAERWLEELLRLRFKELPTASVTAYRLARVTDDRARDVAERLRREAARKMQDAGAKEHWVKAVVQLVELDEADVVEGYGETLPAGLKLVG